MSAIKQIRQGPELAAPAASEGVEAKNRWKALAVLAAGLAMIVLDGTIVGIALPAVIFDLHLGLTDAQWVNSLYSMIFAALLLAFGRLSDRIGRRLQFLIGVVVFVAGSVLAGFAGDAGLLIGARAIQGVGGAMVLPTTVSTINVLFRGRSRAAAFGVWGAVMSGTAAIGPLLGGALTQYADWRWVFFVNVPLGVLVLVGGALWVPENRGVVTGRGVDVGGLLTSALGMGLLVFGLIEGSDLGWWTPARDFTVFGITWHADAPVAAPPVALAVGALFVALFIAWEARRARVGRSVILDLGLFAIRSFSWGNVAAAMVSVGEFALVFVMPLFLIDVAGLDVMGAGFVLAAMALGAFVSGASARHLAARYGPANVVIIGLVLEVVGAVFTALVLGAATPPALIAGTMACYGLGLGLASAQLTSTVMVGVPQELSGAASATQSTVRQVGAALGTALSGTMLAIGLAVRLPARLAEIQGLPATVPGDVVQGTIDSVGGLIPALRAAGIKTTLGEWTPRVADALASGFADATSWALWLATAFLGLGLVASFMVARYGRVAHEADKD